MPRNFDIVVWGATGFTGKLAAEYLSAHYNKVGGPTLKWAIAGRNRAKLDEMRQTLTNPDDVQILVASIDDAESMRALAAQTTVIVSTAGPFDIIGMPVVDACIASSTHYVDITGEATFVRKVIDKHHDAAVRKKLKIVPCCGFDCVPVDMGCSVVVAEMKRRGIVPERVFTTLMKMEGGASGGTINSILNMLDSCSIPQLLALLNPYALCPRDTKGGLDEPGARVKLSAGDRALPYYDSAVKKWCAPFIMQAIDTRVVNRSNALKNWQYGKSFVYREGMAVPNVVMAVLASVAVPVVGVLLYFRVTRFFLQLFLPKSGEGPSLQERENGFFAYHVHGTGHHADSGEARSVSVTVDAPNGDGGYKQTSRMVCEAGICIARMERDREEKGAAGADEQAYGVLTPSTGLGTPYLHQLRDSPGITFLVQE